MFYGVASNTMSGSTFGVSNGMANPALSFATVTDIRDENTRVQPQVLLNNMNGWGLVEKGKALYPFVSDGYMYSGATQQKYNLLNPADTDAAFRLTFSGGWTHAGTGAKPNGTNGFANTHLIPATVLGNYNAYYGYYSRTTSTINGAEMGGTGGGGASTDGNINLYVTYSGANVAVFETGDQNAQVASFDSKGYTSGSCNSQTNRKIYKGGALLNTSTGSDSFLASARNAYIGALNIASAAGLFSNRECAGAIIADKMTDAQDAIIYNLFQTLNTSLFRQI